MKKVIEVCAGILRRGETMLIAQRAEAKHQGMWEFPGGKIEVGETAQESLRRELKEELAVDVVVGELFCDSSWEMKDKVIRLQTFEVSCFTGELQTLVHQDLRWVSVEELADFVFLPADVPVVEDLISHNV
ncbi:MAG: (deoxy)nucleoside triphosphate pyrophosphohydrolase [Lentisphaeraceae bacterium]|nr:(deoxy)nucleoside triphosphate pyrophosphohydrolase [Lentisphaeraceae bacterium]